MTTDSTNQRRRRRAAIWILALTLPATAAFLHFRDDREMAANPFPIPMRDEAAEARFAKAALKFKKSTTGINVSRLDPYETHLTPARLALRGHTTAGEEIAEYAGHLPEAVEFMKETNPQFPRPTAEDTLPTEFTQYKSAVHILMAASIRAALEHRFDDAVAVWEKSGIHRIDSRKSCVFLITGMTLTACSSIEEDALVDLAFFDNDSARIRRIMTVMEANAPDPSLLRRTLAGEFEFVKASAPTIGAMYTAREDLTPYLTPFIKWRLPDWPNLGKALLARWYGLNALPNATMNEYAEIIPKVADPTLCATAFPSFSFFEKHLGRNCGGRALLGLLDENIFSMVRNRLTTGAEALHRIHLAAVAIRLYELEHGKRPAKLTELAPAYLAVAPVDPYDDKPLRYDAAKGWIWSIGKNLKDDAGNKNEDIVLWLPGCEPPDEESPFDTEKRLKTAAAAK